MKKIIRISLILAVLLLMSSPALAQDDQPQNPTYIVQTGDTLWNIARKLHVSYDQLLSQNGLDADSSILPGRELRVPGLTGVSGELTTRRIQFGESLTSLSRMYQIPEDKLARLNRLTTPQELYAGVSVVLMKPEGGEVVQPKRAALAAGESPLELAAQEGVNPWALVVENQQSSRWNLVPGEVLYVPGTSSDGPGALPAEISKVSYSPDTFVQGNTMVIQLHAPQDTELQGVLGDYPLHFFNNGETSYVALQGLHAREDLGLKPLSLSGTLPDGTPFAHLQMVRVLSGNYPFEDILNVPTETVGLDRTEEEAIRLETLASEVTSNRIWRGQFVSPVQPEYSECWWSFFGNRRSFNGSGYLYFHSGLDFCSNLGDSIFAAAPGSVVFTGDLPIHGGTTMIDHGWGVYTLYSHQSEILIREGESVSPGDLIGRIGSTGRSSGPHLHWEVWVGGVQVDPLDWLQNPYP